MATDKATAAHGLRWLQYEQRDWGDWVEGTKAQLQALGLRPGLPYPGEPGAPKLSIKTTDPRGFPVVLIEMQEKPGHFSACVMFPDRPAKPDSSSVHRTLGALRFREFWWCDEYTGTADALVAAGLVRREHLPGAPGMRLQTVSLGADGSPCPGARNSPYMKAQGAKLIERRGKCFSVMVVVSAQESERRRKAESQAVWMWEQHCRSLPRPARLDELKPARGTPLRLVASAAPGALDAPVSEWQRPTLHLVAR